MSETWFASKETPKEDVKETEIAPVAPPVEEEDPKPKPKRSGFSLFKAKEKSPDTSKKGGFSLFRKKSPQPIPDEEGSEEKTPESPKKGGFSFFGRKSDTDEGDFEGDQEGGEEEAIEEAEEEAEVEEDGATFEDSMRNVLRKLGVEVEDDDDWKEMVIKTRLTLKEFKDSLIGSES